MRRMPGEVERPMFGDVRRDARGTADPVDDAELRLALPQATMTTQMLRAAARPAETGPIA